MRTLFSLFLSTLFNRKVFQDQNHKNPYSRQQEINETVIKIELKRTVNKVVTVFLYKFVIELILMASCCCCFNKIDNNEYVHNELKLNNVTWFIAVFL